MSPLDGEPGKTSGISNLDFRPQTLNGIATPGGSVMLQGVRGGNGARYPSLQRLVERLPEQAASSR